MEASASHLQQDAQLGASQQASPKEKWLDNFVIEEVCQEFEEKSTENYHFVGIALYDDFEYSLNDDTNILSPKYIKTLIEKYKSQSIKEQTPNIVDTDSAYAKKQSKGEEQQKRVKLGWVLNTCHKYSHGQHWVAMGLIWHYNNSSAKLIYYDSQGSSGYIKNNETLDCDYTEDCPEDYKHYHPHCEDWEKKLIETLKPKKYEFIHNLQYTQNDKFSCGYHASIFNYFLSNTEKPINYINVLMKQYTETGDVLDEAIKMI